LVTRDVLNQVEYVVSGDKDLLVHQQIHITSIESPAEFVAILEAGA